jgi:hypothetical protein
MTVQRIRERRESSSDLYPFRFILLPSPKPAAPSTYEFGSGCHGDPNTRANTWSLAPRSADTWMQSVTDDSEGNLGNAIVAERSRLSREVAVDGHLADALPSFGRSYERGPAG